MDGYIRVSRVGGRSGESFISPDMQRNQISDWAKRHGIAIDEWFVDLDESGDNLDRPEFIEAMDRIRDGISDGIVVAKIDRFGRSLVGALQAIETIEAAGGHFVSVGEDFDTTTPMGKLSVRMMLTLAEFELDRHREQWREARSNAVSRGIHVTAVAPTGYRRGTDGRLDLDPVAAPVIKEAFHMRAAGKAWPEVSRYLNESGIEGPRGNVLWRRATVAKIIANRVYLGEARSGEFVNREAHEPIIDRATFEAAQKMIAPTPSRTGRPSLLSGIIRCAGCRYCMSPDTSTTKAGKKVRNYYCHKRHSVGICPNPSTIAGEMIEKYVLDDFFGSIEKTRVTATENSKDLERASEAAHAAEAELAAFRDDERVLGLLGQDGFVAGLQVRADAVDEANARLAAIRTAQVDLDPAHIREIWETLDIEEQRELLRSTVGAVFIRKGRMPVGKRATIVSTGDLSSDLPSRGKRIPIRPFAE